MHRSRWFSIRCDALVFHWWTHRCGNRGGHAGRWKGKTDSSHSIKQRANNKYVRDGRAAAINVRSITSQPDQNRAAQAGCYDGEERVRLLTSSSLSIHGKSPFKLICQQMDGQRTHQLPTWMTIVRPQKNTTHNTRDTEVTWKYGTKTPQDGQIHPGNTPTPPGVHEPQIHALLNATAAISSREEINSQQPKQAGNICKLLRLSSYREEPGLRYLTLSCQTTLSSSDILTVATNKLLLNRELLKIILLPVKNPTN